MFAVTKVSTHNVRKSTIDTWLASWDFNGNPFEFGQANHENLLDRYFVRRPFYEQLLASHRSGIIFGDRGGGKTATRIMLESECRPAVSTGNILSVSFTDFSPFAENLGSIKSISLKDYLPHLLRTILPRVLKAVSDSLTWGSELHISDINELRYWIEKYASHLLSEDHLLSELSTVISTSTAEKLVKEVMTLKTLKKDSSVLSEISPKLNGYVTLWGQLVTTSAREPYLPLISPSQIMEAFVKFVLKILSNDSSRCEAIFLLIDGIDEFDRTQNHPEVSIL